MRWYEKHLGCLVLSFICLSSFASCDLVGNYGFFTSRSLSPTFVISQNASILLPSVQRSLDSWINDTNLREFQFYDVLFDYSSPYPGYNSSYCNFDHCELIGKNWFSQAEVKIRGRNNAYEISATTIQAFTNRIRQNGGRSWLYVQSIAADEMELDGFAHLTMPNCDDYCDQWRVGNQTLFFMYQPNSRWARRMFEIFAPFAIALGFDGIHFDQLGSLGFSGESYENLASNFTDFLNSAGSLLNQVNLSMTFNFVDGFAWNSILYTSGRLAFPYWELWTLPMIENEFFDTMANLSAHGVFACYPRLDGGGNPNNPFFPECAPSCPNGLLSNVPCECNEAILILGRWKKAISYGHSYLILGDIEYRLTTEYFPASEEIDPELLAQLEHDPS